jgi:hypothetical protein
MTEGRWLTATDPQAMLETLWTGGRSSERKLRLFGSACCRAIWGLFTDDRSRQAVEVAERYADGAATEQDMTMAEAAASLARDLAFGPASDAPRRHRSRLGRSTSWAAHALTNLPGWAGLAGPEHLVRVVWTDVTEAAGYARDVRGRVRELGRAQAALLRDIFGNTFRPLPPLPRAVLAWNDGLVVRLAQVVYDDRVLPSGHLNPHGLAVLADALEEAGAGADLLEHLRGPGPHVRGCFAVDLLLGRA